MANLRDRLMRKMETKIDNSYYRNRLGYPYRGYEALEYVMKNYDIQSVLDIGCGQGIHSNIFLEVGKDVTAIDYGESYYFKKMKNQKINCIVDDFIGHDFDKQFDCVWCCHVLEHQLNPHDFLTKCVNLTKWGGVLAVSVPPYQPLIVGGHVSLWNAGILLYRLVLAGMDCSNAHIKTYDYDISIVVKKDNEINVLDKISYDMGDIRVIKQYLPKDIEFFSNENDDPFYGNIKELNW